MLKSLHHANLLVGTPEAAELHLRLLCEGLSIKLANNPDFFAFRMETFGIDEARELRLLAARKALVDTKIFLISSQHVTLEAQNALLKTFEDPFPDTYFFLVAREEALVIPTLRSRLQVSRLNLDRQGSTLTQDAEKFLALSLKDRLLFAKKFADEEKSVQVFLDELLLLLRKDKKSSKLLEIVYNIKRSIGGSLVSPRLVIEHLSLVI